jgi:4'-phosphopantetheinyl transferase EntD
MAPIVRSLFAEDVLVDEIDPRGISPSVLAPPEAAQIERAVAKRRREFAAGRLLARRLLRRLGMPESFALVNGEDRAPVWPDGVVGSISHTRTWAAVALARVGDVVSLGCDLEHDKPLDEGVLRRICLPTEREWIASLPAERRGNLAMLVFSAKEAAYKAQYPLTRRVLDFADFAVVFDLEGGSFSAEFQTAIAPWKRGDTLSGRWRTADGMVATAVTIRASDVGSSHSM